MARRGKQFTLRTLFVCVTLACAVVACCARLSEVRSRHRQVKDALSAVGRFSDEGYAACNPRSWSLQYALHGFSQLPLLTSYHVVGDGFEDRHAPLLLECNGLSYVTLGSSHVTDSSMLAVSEMRNLRVLGIANTQITNKGIALLQDHAALESLWLCNNLIDDDVCSSIARMPRLKRLVLKEPRLMGRGITELRKCQSLESLCLDGISVTDRDIEGLAWCDTLWELETPRTNVTGTAFASSGFTALKRLDLDGSMVNDEGLRFIAQLPRLQGVCVSNSGVSDCGISFLIESPTIRYVDVEGTEVSPDLAVAYAEFLRGRREMTTEARLKTHARAARVLRGKTGLKTP